MGIHHTGQLAFEQLLSTFYWCGGDFQSFFNAKKVPFGHIFGSTQTATPTTHHTNKTLIPKIKELINNITIRGTTASQEYDGVFRLIQEKISLQKWGKRMPYDGCHHRCLLSIIIVAVDRALQWDILLVKTTMIMTTMENMTMRRKMDKSMMNRLGTLVVVVVCVLYYFPRSK